MLQLYQNLDRCQALFHSKFSFFVPTELKDRGTSEKQRGRVFILEGLANHIGPESCGDNGNIIREALTGESAGWVLSPVRDLNPSADVLQECRRQHIINRYGEGYDGSAGSETPCMHGDFLGGNREALYLASAGCVEVRMENPEGVRPW